MLRMFCPNFPGLLPLPPGHVPVESEKFSPPSLPTANAKSVQLYEFKLYMVGTLSLQ
ncbi:hypothetical protein D3C87_2174140 [compost metagenome]